MQDYKFSKLTLYFEIEQLQLSQDKCNVLQLGRLLSIIAVIHFCGLYLINADQKEF